LKIKFDAQISTSYLNEKPIPTELETTTDVK